MRRVRDVPWPASQYEMEQAPAAVERRGKHLPRCLALARAADVHTPAGVEIVPEAEIGASRAVVDVPTSMKIVAAMRSEIISV